MLKDYSRMLWMTVVIFSWLASATACSDSDNPSGTDTKVLSEWQAGKTVNSAAVEAYGGIDRCFAAEPIPDGVWQRMQGKTYKENPHIGRNDLRHIRALHWDHDDLCFRLFTEAGFEWGGDWTTRKDFQHFELIE